jgi:hypothetical protein
VIASFSYLSPTDLGWDPTCKFWDSVVGTPRPSYDSSQDIFKDCGVYDLPWVFEVDDEMFVVIKAVNEERMLSIRGRASFVVHAVTLADWETKNEKGDSCRCLGVDEILIFIRPQSTFSNNTGSDFRV